MKQTAQWIRRRTQWLARRVHTLTVRQRIICASVAGVLLLAAIIPTVQFLLESHRYTLDDATLKLVGTSNPNQAESGSSFDGLVTSLYDDGGRYGEKQMALFGVFAGTL